MKKLYFIVLIVSCLTAISNAQTVSAYIEAATPTGNFSKIANVGYGGIATFEITFLPLITPFAEVGYIGWSGKNQNVIGYTVSSTISAVPLQAGLKVPVTMGIYGIAEIGVHFFSVKSSATIPNYGTFSQTTTSTNGSAGVGAGYELTFIPLLKLDVNVIYEYISPKSGQSSSSYISARAGLKLGI
jgi:hypothetical protein